MQCELSELCVKRIERIHKRVFAMQNRRIGRVLIIMETVRCSWQMNLYAVRNRRVGSSSKSGYLKNETFRPSAETFTISYSTWPTT